MQHYATSVFLGGTTRLSCEGVANPKKQSGNQPLRREGNKPQAKKRSKFRMTREGATGIRVLFRDF